MTTMDSRSRNYTIPQESPHQIRCEGKPFVHKLYEMACCEDHESTFGFSVDGKNVEIRDMGRLPPVLVQYFKHNNPSSFVRQLNNYGFKTVASTSNSQVFTHPNFYRDHPDLEVIARKSTRGSLKRCKTLILLKEGEVDYRKQFRELEIGYNELKEANRRLEMENKRLRMTMESFSATQSLQYPVFTTMYSMSDMPEALSVPLLPFEPREIPPPPPIDSTSNCSSPESSGKPWGCQQQQPNAESGMMGGGYSVDFSDPDILFNPL